MFIIYKAIILLQLLNIQPLVILHTFCLISIVGIVVELQIVQVLLQFADLIPDGKVY